MAVAAFNLPKQWEDWTNWGLGIWLCLSPWALSFSGDAIATENAVIVGFLIILAEVLTLSIFEVWEEWISVILGAWLVVSSWVLTVTSTAAKADFVVVGVLVAALALYEMWEARRNPGPQT
jgi:SPW repeat-containing protein